MNFLNFYSLFLLFTSFLFIFSTDLCSVGYHEYKSDEYEIGCKKCDERIFHIFSKMQ